MHVGPRIVLSKRSTIYDTDRHVNQCLTEQSLDVTPHKYLNSASIRTSTFAHLHFGHPFARPVYPSVLPTLCIKSMALPQPEDVVEISYLSPTFAPANWSESDRWAFSDHPRSHLILSPKTVFKAEVPIFLGQEMNRTRNLDCRDGLVIVPLLSRDEDPLISICYHPSGAGHLEFANLDRKIFDLLQLSPRVVGRQYVTSLHIHNMKFKSIQHFGEAIHRYPQLKTLYISNTEISDFGPPYHKSIQRSLLERIDSPPRLLGLHDSEGLSSPGSILTIYWMLASPGEISLESLTIVDSAPAYKLLSASSRTLVRTCVTGVYVSSFTTASFS